MTIILKQYNTVVTIENDRDDLDIYEVIEELVRPALLAAGFQPESISRTIGEPS